MRVGLLQFSPSLGNIEANAARISELVRSRCKQPLDLLVLPEMALTGYAFGSARQIKPFLESPTGASYQLASALCKHAPSTMTIMGYPERGDDKDAYNAGLVANKKELLYSFRKKHLFETDETWAREGESFGLFQTMTLPSKALTVALGICMDLNPYQFKAPFEAYEFGEHCVAHKADIIVVPMAWIKNEAGTSGEDTLHAVRYWLTRLGPVLRQERKVLAIFANRTGSEGAVSYQGHSCVVLIDHGDCTVLGKLDFDEDLLVVDYDIDP